MTAPADRHDIAFILKLASLLHAHGYPAHQLEAVLADLRALLRDDPGVHPETIVVNFANYGASSLDLQLVWFAHEPDWARHMAVRERINLKIMRAVAARGLAFAFPTQTVHVPAAKKT